MDLALINSRISYTDYALYELVMNEWTNEWKKSIVLCVWVLTLWMNAMDLVR